MVPIAQNITDNILVQLLLISTNIVLNNFFTIIYIYENWK